jgi:protein-disulfide isomerase
MSGKFWAVIGVIAVIFFGVIIFKGNHDASAPGGGQPTQHIKGEGKKDVSLVEYGDYQCPACGGYEPIVEQVFQKYSGDIKFQFRNLPLSQKHPNAFAAARAAEAASLQNKFWEMHDTLYRTQNNWSSSKNVSDFFNAYAKQLGLNTTKFKDDFVSSTVNDFVNADVAAFNKTGAETATPSFFLNGKLIKPVASVEGFAKFIDPAIAAKQ